MIKMPSIEFALGIYLGLMIAFFGYLFASIKGFKEKHKLTWGQTILHFMRND